MADPRISARFGLAVWDVGAGIVRAADGTADWLPAGGRRLDSAPTTAPDVPAEIVASLLRGHAQHGRGTFAVAVVDAHGRLTLEGTREGSAELRDLAAESANRAWDRLPWHANPQPGAAVRVLLSDGAVAAIVAMAAEPDQASALLDRLL